MVQQYFCVRKSNEFLRAIVGKCVGLFGLSVDVDERNGLDAADLSYPEGSRASLKLDPYDTFMLEALRKKHDTSINSVFRHSLRIAFYLQFGMTPPECPLTIELAALGLASLEEMEFGAGAQGEGGERGQITPQLRAVLFGVTGDNASSRVRLHTSPERDGSSRPSTGKAKTELDTQEDSDGQASTAGDGDEEALPVARFQHELVPAQ